VESKTSATIDLSIDLSKVVSYDSMKQEDATL
jgi:hypothetical protein